MPSLRSQTLRSNIGASASFTAEYELPEGDQLFGVGINLNQTNVSPLWVRIRIQNDKMPAGHDINIWEGWLRYAGFGGQVPGIWIPVNINLKLPLGKSIGRGKWTIEYDIYNYGNTPLQQGAMFFLWLV